MISHSAPHSIDILVECSLVKEAAKVAQSTRDFGFDFPVSLRMDRSDVNRRDKSYTTLNHIDAYPYAISLTVTLVTY